MSFTQNALDARLLLLANADLREEGTDVVALVALQLDHLAVLGVLNQAAIAGKLLSARDG